MHDRIEASPLTEPRLIAELTALAAQACARILAVMNARTRARTKPDGSPVTDADEASEAAILEGLARIMPGVPVVSEERAADAPALPRDGAFALVDPLDGTREFVAGRDEFVVNIAIVARGTPVVGIIAAPALATVWRGVRGQGAERLAITPSGLGEPSAIRARRLPAQGAVALVSRSHLDARSEALLARAPGIARVACGSALKFCRLAEGGADVYPRLATTCEWDVGAGDALLTAASGVVIAPDGSPLAYGNTAAGFRVPGFVACADAAAAARFLAPQ